MDCDIDYQWQMWFPGQKSWELWVHAQGKVQKIKEQTAEDSLVFDASLNGKRILALPVSYQVAHPFLSNARDAEGLLQTARMHVDRQGLTFDVEGLMVEPVDSEPPHTIARIDSPIRKGKKPIPCAPLPDLIVPAASILPLKRNSFAIWDELGKPVVAFERNQRTIYYDQLSGGPKIAHEVDRMQFQLLAHDLIEERPRSMSLWNERYLSDFKEHALFSGIETQPAPRTPHPHRTLLPAWFREEKATSDLLSRRARAWKRTAALGWTMGALAAILLSFTCVRQWNLNREMARLEPPFNRIRAIQNRWNDLATAVDPERSPLEVWRNLFSLSRIADVKINKMDISLTSIDVSGTSGSAKMALKFIEEVTTDPAFSHLTWQYEPPLIERNGAASFNLHADR